MARPRQVTDEEILRAARACTLERGPAVSLDVVAERLGVTPPALIKRFGSRRALLLAALRPIDDPDWIREIGDGPDDRPLAEQLEQKLERMLDRMLKDVPCLVALRESGIPFEEIFEHGATPQPVRGVRALASWLERARERGQAHCDDSETVASAIMGALHGRIFLGHLLNRSWLRSAQHQFIHTLAQLFARALTPEKAAAGKRRARHSVLSMGGKR